MEANEIMLSIEYLDKYKCRIEIDQEVVVKDLVLSLTKLFKTDYQERYTLVDRETGRYLDREKSLADQQVQEETVFRLDIGKVNVIITDTISGNEASLRVRADSTIDEILKAALEMPNLTIREKKINYKLKQEGEDEDSMSRIKSISENSRYLLIEDKKIKIRLRKKADIDFEKEIHNLLNSRPKIKKVGFCTCKACGYKWVVEICHKCGVDNTRWIETEHEFELRKNKALEKIKKRQAAYDYKFVELQVPLSTKHDDLINIVREAHPNFFKTKADEDHYLSHSISYYNRAYNIKLRCLRCLESNKEIKYQTDLYDAGVEEGNTIEVKIQHEKYGKRMRQSDCVIWDPDLGDDQIYQSSLIDFWKWFKSSYPELNPFVSLSHSTLCELMYNKYIELTFFCGLTWIDSYSFIRKSGKLFISLEELKNRMQSETGVTKDTPNQELAVMLPDYESILG